MTYVIGSDVSFYQYKYEDATLKKITEWIDFEKMKTLSPFVIIRAGQNTWKDICFDVSWKNAKDAGLSRGSYWFYDSRATPQSQAEKWADTLNGDLGELPLWCDIEDNYGGPYGSWKHWYNFIERLKLLVPKKEIGIYTAYYYWLERTVVKGIPAASLEYFKQYPLWIANYGVSIPLVPKPWNEWTFWQYMDNGDGEAYGVKSKQIDLNYFNGDFSEFRSRFRISDTVTGKINIDSLLVSLDSGEQIRFNKRGE